MQHSHACMYVRVRARGGRVLPTPPKQARAMATCTHRCLQSLTLRQLLYAGRSSTRVAPLPPPTHHACCGSCATQATAVRSNETMRPPTRGVMIWLLKGVTSL